jgi:hypothetical protein
MFKGSMIIGLLAMSVILTLGTEVKADCISNPPYCASWIHTSLTGVNQCKIDSTIVTKGCSLTDGTCPTTTYTVTGTINPDTGQVCANIGDPATCVIPIVVTCWPKHCDNNPNQPSCKNVTTVRGHLNPGAISVSSEDAECQKKNCRVSRTSALVVSDDEVANVCPAGQTVADFLILQFVGVQDCCAGGYDVNDQCCQDQTRTPNDTCAVLGQPQHIKQTCCADETLQVGGTYPCFDFSSTSLPAACTQ